MSCLPLFLALGLCTPPITAPEAPRSALEARQLWKDDYPSCEFIVDEFDNLALKCPAVPGTNIGRSAAIYSFGADPATRCTAHPPPKTRACRPFGELD
jgi:hypothetical protein